MAAWRVLSAAAIGGGLGLVLFHVWLFWGHWQDGRLGDPVIAAKWVGSALLLAGLALLHRSGRALLLGRQAIVIWALAALIHIGAGQPPALHAPPSSSPAAVLFVIPSLAGAMLAAAALVAAARRARLGAPGLAPVLSRLTPPPDPRVPLLAQPHGLRAPPVAFP